MPSRSCTGTPGSSPATARSTSACDFSRRREPSEGRSVHRVCRKPVWPGRPGLGIDAALPEDVQERAQPRGLTDENNENYLYVPKATYRRRSDLLDPTRHLDQWQTNLPMPGPRRSHRRGSTDYRNGSFRRPFPQSLRSRGRLYLSLGSVQKRLDCYWYPTGSGCSRCCKTPRRSHRRYSRDYRNGSFRRPFPQSLRSRGGLYLWSGSEQRHRRRFETQRRSHRR